MWYVLMLIGSIGLAIWLAITGAGIYALPLVMIIAGLARMVVRRAQGRRITVADVALRRHDS